MKQLPFTRVAVSCLFTSLIFCRAAMADPPDYFVLASWVVVPSEKAAERVHEWIERGWSVGYVANRISVDKASSVRGGLLDVVRCSNYVPEVAIALCSLPLGVPSQPLKTDFGWAVLVAHDRAPTPKSLDFSKLPAYRPVQFDPHLTLSCGPVGPGNIDVVLDLQNAMATYNGYPTLPVIKDFGIGLWASNGVFMEINRKDGSAWARTDNGWVIANLTCTALTERRF